MASRIEAMRETARKNPKTIVLPEGFEPRVLKAAGMVASLGLGRIILLGKEAEIRKLAGKHSVSLDNIRVIDPEKYPERRKMVDTLFEIRKHKGMTADEADRLIAQNPVYFAALLVRFGDADGFVAGASYSTADVARPAIFCIGLDENIGIMSSSFVVEVEDSACGEEGLFVFGDCGIVPDPTPENLADIAISCSQLYETLFKRKARVALLSYSTKGSARGDSIDKVRKALEIIKQKAPDLTVDGELQSDAAIVPEVAKIKAPGSVIAGKANVLIFPNLDAGNISYKLVQRLAKARVVGPLLEGTKKPASDLSRGCAVEEIVDTIVATVVRAG